MKINKHATSIVEAIVSMVIITIWIVWMYNIFISSTNLEETINNKMVGVAIAREWIEAMTNIRDTNWIIFWSDTKNCWNTLNYTGSCIMNTNTTFDIQNNWRYRIYKNTNNRWTLTGSSIVSSDYTDSDYRNFFVVWIDSSDWSYTQTWITIATSNLKPLFTREIIVEYETDSNDEKMEVTSLVQWKDKSNQEVHKVELKTILSNWKKG
jgi:hypothetical protein